MIPKKIHYCWFGRGPKPTLVLKCIESWKKYLSDYEIIEWNEENFNVNSNLYVMQAYRARKFAFVSDYVRLYALYNEGGIYFDTDVEVRKNLDEFLTLDGFTGFEDENWTVTATMASEPNNMVINRLLRYYDNRRFGINGRYDLTTNTNSITHIFKQEYGIRLDGTKQQLKGTNFIIYPKDYFCACNWLTKETKITENTYTIHHFNASWH